jgi:hypothetical protein
MNGDREQQENDGRRYRDGIPMKDDGQFQQQDGKRYGDTSSKNAEKEYRQKNGDSTPERQDEGYCEKGGQKESPGSQRYSN